MTSGEIFEEFKSFGVREKCPGKRHPVQTVCEGKRYLAARPGLPGELCLHPIYCGQEHPPGNATGRGESCPPVQQGQKLRPGRRLLYPGQKLETSQGSQNRSGSTHSGEKPAREARFKKDPSYAGEQLLLISPAEFIILLLYG